MTMQLTPPTVLLHAGPRLKISAAYGRLYVSGPDARRAVAGVNGMFLNGKSLSYEVSLTLETLRRMRRETGATKEQFARCCTPDVLAWARAAGESERVVTGLHARLATGWRMDFPWTDTRAHTLAPDTAPARDCYTDEAGVKRWAYREPFGHQTVMATVASALDGSAFLCEMGTGKTRSAVEVLRHLMSTGTLDMAVVVCPKGVMSTWEAQVQEWSVGLTTLRLDGQVKNRKKVIESYVSAMPAGRLVLLVNYDVMYLLTDELIALAKSRKVGMVCDEMHRLKNPQAKVTKAEMRVAQHMRWRLGMTGTPILQGIEDVWSQWYVVDLGITFGANYRQYKREFMIENTYAFSLTARDGALDEVGQRLRRRGLRYTKADCLDLPPKVYETIEVELTREQRTAYRQMEEELIALLSAESDEVATAANQLVMILRLTQITSGFVTNSDGGLYVFPKNPKLDAMEEMVREASGAHQQLVWATYRQDVQEIASRLASLGPRIINGQVKQQDRDAAQRDFRDGRCRLIVANQAAGGVGLNLQAASVAHYFSQDYSLEHRQQSEDRCHRSGSEQHNKVTYFDYIAKGTIDEVVVRALRDKKRVADVVVDLKQAIGMTV